MNNTIRKFYHKEIEQIHNNTTKPLIHYITNYVTVGDMANMTLAFGGSPIMAEAVEEIPELTACCSCLVINIGTITTKKLPSIKMALRVANDSGVPIILDPVGVAATSYRKKIVLDILENYSVQVIKGNGSEIKAILGLETQGRGVDSLDTDCEELSRIGVAVAKKYNTIVAITGKEDLVCSSTHIGRIHGDTPKLMDITGTGCMISTLIGVAYGRCGDGFISSVYGLLAMHLGACRAEEKLEEEEGIGTYRVKLFDAIYNQREEDLLLKKEVAFHEVTE